MQIFFPVIFSTYPLLLFFLLLFFLLLFFLLPHCYFLSCYFFSCYFFSCYLFFRYFFSCYFLSYNQNNMVDLNVWRHADFKNQVNTGTWLPQDIFEDMSKLFQVSSQWPVGLCHILLNQIAVKYPSKVSPLDAFASIPVLVIFNASIDQQLVTADDLSIKDQAMLTKHIFSSIK